MTLKIRVIAPDRTVWNADAEEVILPSSTGQFRNTNRTHTIIDCIRYRCNESQNRKRLDTNRTVRRFC